MSKIVATKDKDHTFRMRSDGDAGELVIVGKGRGAYLWAGRDNDGGCVTFSGPQSLRALARKILALIPEKP